MVLGARKLKLLRLGKADQSCAGGQRAQCPGVCSLSDHPAPLVTQPGDPEAFFLQFLKSSPKNVPAEEAGAGETGVGRLETTGAASFLLDTE